MGPARCCLGFSFWLVRPLPLWDIWFSSGTGKLNNFNKAERKHNDFGGGGVGVERFLLMFACFSSGAIN